MTAAADPREMDRTQLDEAICERVMGWRRERFGVPAVLTWWQTETMATTTPNFSTDWNSAMRIVNHLNKKGVSFSTRDRFSHLLQEEVSRKTFVGDAIPENARERGMLIHARWMIYYLTPDAICRAALRALDTGETT